MLINNKLNLTEADYLNKYFLCIDGVAEKPFDNLADCLAYAKRKHKPTNASVKSIRYHTTMKAQILYIEYSPEELAQMDRLKSQMLASIQKHYRNGKANKQFLADCEEYFSQSKIGIIPPLPWQE